MKAAKVMCALLLTAAVLPVQSLAAADEGYRLNVNGAMWTLDNKPILRGNVLMAPVEDVFESAGLHYYKSASGDRIQGTDYRTEVTLAVGSTQMAINGAAYDLTRPIEIVDGIVMVPVRSFYEALGARVVSISGKREIEVTTTHPLGQKLQHYIQDYMRDHDFRGAVLVVKDGRTLLNASFGMADEAKNIANTADTQYRVASLTKPITAVAIAQLEEEGRLSLEDTLDQYFPEQSAWHAIRIKHLLAHQSGLQDLSDLLVTDAARTNGKQLTRDAFEAYFDQVMTVDEQLKLIGGSPLLFAPGEQEDYSNANYLLLGRIIEQVSGMRYEEYVQARILTPARMAHTTFDEGDAPNLAAGHSVNRSTIHEPTETQYAYGGMISTVQDLYAFDEALRQGILVKGDTYERMITPLQDGSYGYAWNVTPILGEQAYAHNGDLLGFHARMMRLTDSGATIIILSNNQLDLYALIRSIVSNDPAGAMAYMEQRAAMGYAEELSLQLASIVIRNARGMQAGSVG